MTTKVPRAKRRKWGQVDNDTSWIHEEWSLDERNDGYSFDEWNDDRNCVAWREDCEQTRVTSASSFSLETSEFGQHTSIETQSSRNWRRKFLRLDPRR